VPQAHCPDVVQVSERPPQLVQLLPWTPHVATDRMRQLAPWQQPFGQLVALQVQLPFTHCCPGAQAAWLPHRQLPVDEQLSPLSPQAMQAAPPLPHSPAFGGVTQVAPEQQPLAQLLALQPEQLPPVQVCGDGQL
jgi:hypothetical protein